jgi:hypothetical protein
MRHDRIVEHDVGQPREELGRPLEDELDPADVVRVLDRAKFGSYVGDRGSATSIRSDQ